MNNNTQPTSQSQSYNNTQQNTAALPTTVAGGEAIQRSMINRLRAEFEPDITLSETALELWVEAAEAAMKRQEKMTIALLLKLLEKRPKPLPPLLAVYQEYCQGTLALIESNWEQADVHLNRALEELAKFHPSQKATDKNDKYSELEANLLITHARALADLGQREEAQKIIQQVLPFVQANQLASIESKALSVLAFISWCEAKFQEMLNYARLALDCANKSNDAAAKLRSLQFIGIGNVEQGLYEEAIKAYEQAIQTCRLSGQTAKSAPICINLALIYFRLNKNEEALATFKMGLNLSKQRGDKVAMAIVLQHIGETHLKLKQYQEAVQSYQQAWQLSQQIDNLNCKLLAAGSLARFLAEFGSPEEAQGYITKTRELLETADTPIKVVTDYLVISYANFTEALLRLSTTEQEIEEARFYQEQHDAICRKSGDLTPITDLQNKLTAILRNGHKFSGSPPALAILTKAH
jgi:tetratricopeptide (TPR) repeat protein